MNHWDAPTAERYVDQLHARQTITDDQRRAALDGIRHQVSLKPSSRFEPQDIEAFYTRLPGGDSDPGETPVYGPPGAADEVCEDSPARTAISYQTRLVVAATLPHAQVEDRHFTRSAGRYRFSVSLDPSISSEEGLIVPYGSYPRLFLMWLASEVRQRRTRDIELGRTQTELMRALRIPPKWGRNGSNRRFERNIKSLLACSWTCWWRQGDDESGGLKISMRSLVDESEMWWTAKRGGQRHFNAWLRLSEPFFQEMADNSFPVDWNAVAQISDWPLALDLYSWLTYRFRGLNREVIISWDDLYDQFGRGEISDDRHGRYYFRQRLLKALEKVWEVYGTADVEKVSSGLKLRPSPPHVALRRRNALR